MSIKRVFRKMVFVTAAMLAASAQAHDGPAVPTPVSLDALLNAFGWDMATAEVTSQKIADDFYVLFGVGGNVAVSLGENGVLIVDDQFPQMMPKLESAIASLGGSGVDFAINTHWHFDHAEGNLALGPGGTWLVSQANSRQMMQDDHVINLVGIAYEQKAYPPAALPVITYDDVMHFHFNGQRVDLMHFGPAHTTGDTAIIFRGTNAVHLGDVFNNAGYPFIDAGNGGTIDGLIRFCSETLRQINEDTVVVPGHGPVTDYATLVAYVEMLTTVRGRMMTLIESGASLEAVYAAKVTAEFDEKFGDSTGFINRSYMSLTHRIVDR
ncbi:MAG: MBL fold metallo-hydrolase [Proteobacteria bacterium]|nr:MBL fold metallo-hydrolase [Pseudomonadota bacterium]MDA1301588.1 MBL fold metallo-hydrolase [Pseudomonadota bacterium]